MGKGATSSLSTAQVNTVIAAAFSALLFTLFTAALLLAHVYLILHNMSSVESLIVRGMKADENDVLNQLAPAWHFL